MVGQESATTFLSRVTACGLLTPERVAGCAGCSRDDAAAELVREQLLTPFQARQLLNGRAAALFPSPKFKVLDILGEGGMGRVLLCEHLVLQKLVAVKELHPSALSPDETARGPFGRENIGHPGAVERFLREARAAAALDHPNIVRVLDVDTSGRLPLIVMEFVDGTDLHTLVAEHGAMPVDRVASYVRQTAAALAHADAVGLVHRDIKPGNLMLDRAGRVRVIDFGLSRTAAADDWDEQFLLGTADFAAPEQAARGADADIRADIYSLGCTAYFLLAGRFPFPGGDVSHKIRRHRTDDPRPLAALRSDIPAGLAAVIRTMMRKRPADRYQSAAEVVAALAPFVPDLLPPPADAEMPDVRPSSYRLGLTPMRPVAGAAPRPVAVSTSLRPTPAPMAALQVGSKVYEKLAADPLPAQKARTLETADTTPMRSASAGGLSAVALAVAAAGFFAGGLAVGLLVR